MLPKIMLGVKISMIVAISDYFPFFWMITNVTCNIPKNKLYVFFPCHILFLIRPFFHKGLKASKGKWLTTPCHKKLQASIKKH
jgi:hypothetical protein